MSGKKKAKPFIHTDGNIGFKAENPCGCFEVPAVAMYTITLRCVAPNQRYILDKRFSKRMYTALDAAMRSSARRGKSAANNPVNPVNPV